MKNNLTKLFCDLISTGSQLGDTSVPLKHIGHHLRSFAVQHLPADCDVNFDDIDEHIANVRSAMTRKGSDYDIDAPALRVGSVTEFHGKFTVKLSNGGQISFESSDIMHY